MFNKSAIDKLKMLLSDTSDAEIIDVIQKLDFLCNDESNVEHENNFPSIARIYNGYISILENGKYLVADKKDIFYKKENMDFIRNIIFDDGPKYLPHIPLYDLYIIKRPHKIKETPEDSMVAGKFFRIGKPLETGTYRYPLIAQPLLSGKKLQIHKIGDNIIVFDTRGNIIQTNTADVIGKMDVPEYAIFSAIYNDKLFIVDIFDCTGYIKAYRMTCKDRIALLSSFKYPDGVEMIPIYYVDNEKKLACLPQGKYVVKWEKERINIVHPFWFTYVSGDEPQQTSKLDASVFSRLIQDISPLYGNIMIIHNIATIFIGDGRNINFTCNVAFDVQPILRAIDINIIIGAIYKKHNSITYEIFIKHPLINGAFHISDGTLYKMDDDYIPIICNNEINKDFEFLIPNSLAIEALNNNKDFNINIPFNWEEYVEEYDGIDIIGSE